LIWNNTKLSVNQDIIAGINSVRSHVYQFSLVFFTRYTLALAFSLFLIAPIQGQDRKVDSLLQQLPKSGNSQRADVLYELAYEYIVIDVSEALKYSLESYTTARGVGDSLRMVKAGRLITSAYRRMEKLDSAIYFAEIALDIAIRNRYTEEMKILYNSVAIAYAIRAEYDKALEYHFKSLVVREKDGNKSEISITLNNIGFVYFKLKNYEKALEYFEKSIALKDEVGDTYDMDAALINVGLCNIHLKKFNEALVSISKGLSICALNCSDEIKIEGEFGLGVAYFGLTEFDSAESHFNSSLVISRRINNKRWQAENLVYLGRVALKTNNQQLAATFLLEAESIASASGFNQIRIDTYKEFSNLYNQSEDFQKASFYQNKYISLKDSIIGEELVKNIAKIQTQFEERQNIATIKDREEALARQRMLNVAIGIIAVLAALLVFVLYRSNKVKKRVNAQLSDAKAIIEDQNKTLKAQAENLQREVDKATANLKVVNESLQKVNAELDNFIYKTSHDIRGPLASLKGMCNVALMDVKDPLALDYLQKLDVTAAKLNRILTRLLIINQINNATILIEPLELNSILDDIILLETKKGIPQSLVFKREVQSNIIFHSDDALIRIILENLVDNSIKFSNHSARIEPFVLIRIGADEKQLNIQVIDNGLGITETQPEKIFQMFSRVSERSSTGSLGLYLIKQATTRLGGDVTYRKTEEGYTEFMVSLPLKVPAELLLGNEV
jgi:signal transduction histidine kinase